MAMLYIPMMLVVLADETDIVQQLEAVRNGERENERAERRGGATVTCTYMVQLADSDTFLKTLYFP